MKENIYNIINYLRRSRQDIEREKRTGEDTLATQKRIMSKVLDDFKSAYDQVEEIGSGDKIETRPVFQLVLKNLEEGKYNAVAVKEIPRLGRGAYSDMGKIYDLLVSKRIFVITPYKTYDPQNPADARQIRFELFFAREEFEMIKERLISAKYNLAHEGKWVCGAAPFGYRLVYNTGRLEIAEEEAQTVRLIYNLYVYGMEINGLQKDVSFRAIASYLTRMGLSTPRRAISWSHLTVRRIIENVVYIGTLKYCTRKRVANKYFDRPKNQWIIVEHAHEALIDTETWTKSQAKINEIKVNPHVKLDFSPCELAGLIICSKCGHHMVRQYSIQHYRKKTGKLSTYHKEFLLCPTTGCTCVKYRDVESSILNYLETLGKFNPIKLTELIKQYYKKQTSLVSVNTAESVEKRISGLKRKLRFICEKFEAGIYNDQLFNERKKEIEKELSFLRSVNIINNETVPDKVKVDIKENIKTFLDAYRQAGDKTLKNKLLRQLITSIHLNKTDKGKFNLTIRPRINLNIFP